MNKNTNLFSLIPKVDDLLYDEKVKGLLKYYPRVIIVESVREEVDILRNEIRKGEMTEENIRKYIKNLPNKIELKSENKMTFHLKKAINATGVVIHTNLGRSLINEEVMDNVFEIATNYSNLEFNLYKGERGSRYAHLEDVITDITGGESAMVVNNNAAAVLLVLSTLAKDREVIVSRGELIEIGGSFRVPDVMEQSGAHLVAVGTTNKTHLWDYEKAITEETAALLKVHTSNYRVVGFSSSVDSEELNNLKNKYDIPLIEDLGSGVLIDLSKYGLEYEPTVQDSLKNGVDIVTFSGDKLLGGPQAGIIVGKKKYIDEMKKNPLTRAFRVDKFTISALEATLKLYIEEETAVKKIPTLNMLTLTRKEINERAILLYEKLNETISYDDVEINIVDDYSEVGGGSLPLEKLPTKCIAISLENNSVAALERELRHGEIPIVVRVYNDKVLLDLRTIKEDEFDTICESLSYSVKRIKGVL